MLAMASINTAPAAISFASRIKGFFSGLTLSQTRSIAVLNASAINTPPMQSTIMHHSTFESPTISPAATTSTAATIWILACASLRKSLATPLPAYLNASILFLR